MRIEFILFGLMAIWASGLFFGTAYANLNQRSRSETVDAKNIMSFTHAGWICGIGGVGLLALGFFS